MTENKRFTMDNPNDWDFSITDNVTGKVYNCASNILMKDLCVVVNTIVEENEQLKKQLLYDGDDVCGICKHEYLVPSGDYFIGKCKKEHKECSKEDIKYCEDFEKVD